MIIAKINGAEYEESSGVSVSYSMVYPEKISSLNMSSDEGSSAGYDTVKSIEDAQSAVNNWEVYLVDRVSGQDDVILGYLGAFSMRSTVMNSNGYTVRSLTFK